MADTMDSQVDSRSVRFGISMVAAAYLCVAAWGCGGGSGEPAAPDTPPGADVPHAYEERYFAEHPDAALRPQHTTIFHLETTAEEGDTGAVGVDVVPYEFARTTDLTLTREDVDTSPTLVLKNASGQLVRELIGATNEAALTITAGRYTLELHPPPAPTSSDGATMFIQSVAFTPGANANDVARLKAGMSCPNCDFTGLVWTVGEVAAINLSGANFKGSTLDFVTFTRTTLTGAVFDSSTFAAQTAGPLFYNTLLSDASLQHVSIRGTTFQDVPGFTPGTLSGANFTGAAFVNSCLGSSDLTNATFAQATFDENSAVCATFSGSDLSSASFDGTATSNCYCRAAPTAVFQGATLTGPSSGVLFDSVDLSGIDFHGMNLSGDQFNGSVLSGAMLAHATISSTTDFTGATLAGVDLSAAVFPPGYAAFAGVDLTGANLSNVDLRQAQLSMTVLTGATMIATYLYQADLSGALLVDADMHSATLSYATLQGANLGGAVLFNTTADHAYMPDAVLTDADLRTASFAAAQLYGGLARIDGALFGGADFTVAILSGLDFTRIDASGAKFDNAQLVNCSFDGGILTSASFPFAYLQGASFNGTDCRPG